MTHNTTIYGRHPAFANRGGFTQKASGKRSAYFKHYREIKAAANAALDRLNATRGKDVR